MCRDNIWAKICEVSANVSLVHQLRQKAAVPGAEGATVVMLRYPVKYAFSIFASLLFRSELTNAETKFPAGPVRIPPLRSAWGENPVVVAVDSANDPASNLGPETEQPTAAERTIENFDHLSRKVSSGRFEA
jgi:hypothetical protein